MKRRKKSISNAKDTCSDPLAQARSACAPHWCPAAQSDLNIGKPVNGDID
jgi:hypothetical protein